jgi:hypothetical protein
LVLVLLLLVVIVLVIFIFVFVALGERREPAPETSVVVTRLLPVILDSASGSHSRLAPSSFLFIGQLITNKQAAPDISAHLCIVYVRAW